MWADIDTYAAVGAKLVVYLDTVFTRDCARRANSNAAFAFGRFVRAAATATLRRRACAAPVFPAAKLVIDFDCHFKTSVILSAGRVP